jgi:hypothetical protein
MATDGPKVIDGDIAHDTYWDIMDLYDNEVDIERVVKEFPVEVEDYNEFEYEIYVTVLALAFWEIGALSEGLLQTVRHTIDRGVGVRFWTEESGEKEGRERQRELDRLWNKITKPNTKIRKRKKYRRVTNYHFHPDDLLTFKLNDDNYYAVICAEISQYRGQCNYGLALTTYRNSRKPTPQDLENYEIVGGWIESGYDMRSTRQLQPGIEDLWRLFPNRTNFFFGISYHLVTHRDFYSFRDRFESVGSLRIKASFKKTQSYGYESTFNRFEELLADLDGQIKTFHEEKVSVKVLCEP